MLQSQIGERGQIQFDADFLTPGTYSVYAITGENSIVSSLKAKGAQVVGQTVQITGGKPVELEISLSNTSAKINGTAREDDKPVAGAMILLVPENAEVNLPKDINQARRPVAPQAGCLCSVDGGAEPQLFPCRY